MQFSNNKWLRIISIAALPLVATSAIAKEEGGLHGGGGESRIGPELFFIAESILSYLKKSDEVSAVVREKADALRILFDQRLTITPTGTDLVTLGDGSKVEVENMGDTLRVGNVWERMSCERKYRLTAHEIFQSIHLEGSKNYHRSEPVVTGMKASKALECWKDQALEPLSPSKEALYQLYKKKMGLSKQARTLPSPEQLKVGQVWSCSTVFFLNDQDPKKTGNFLKSGVYRPWYKFRDVGVSGWYDNVGVSQIPAMVSVNDYALTGGSVNDDSISEFVAVDGNGNLVGETTVSKSNYLYDLLQTPSVINPKLKVLAFNLCPRSLSRPKSETVEALDVLQNEGKRAFLDRMLNKPVGKCSLQTRNESRFETYSDNTTWDLKDSRYVLYDLINGGEMHGTTYRELSYLYTQHTSQGRTRYGDLARDPGVIYTSGDSQIIGQSVSCKEFKYIKGVGTWTSSSSVNESYSTGVFSRLTNRKIRTSSAFEAASTALTNDELSVIGALNTLLITGACEERR